MNMPDTDAGGDTDAAGSTTTTSTDIDGKFLSQTQIDSIVGRAENKAAKAAKAELLAELGMDIDDAKKAIADANAEAEARLTREQRLERKLAEQEAIAAQALAQAQQAATQSRIVAALSGRMDAAAIKRIAPTINLSHDATDEDIADVIDELERDLPGLFSDQPTTPPGAVTTTQSRQRPPARQTAVTQADADREWVDNFLRDEVQGGELPLL